MTRVMFDSTNVADDPAGADLVAYYADGIYATTAAAVRQRFPTQVLVAISAVGTDTGVVGDVEPGCMTISQSIAWVIRRRGAGLDPSLYVNEVYGWAPCAQAFQQAGVPEPHWWVADYDGVAVIPPGAIAKQYENPPLDGGHFDRSVVADFWPGIDGLFGNPEHAGGYPVGTVGALDEAWLTNAGKILGQLVAQSDEPGVQYNLPAMKSELDAILAAVQKIAAPAAVDLSAVLAAIADLKAHPAFDPADASILAIVQKLEQAAKAAGAAA